MKECKDCKFWQILPEEGQCRRYAPRLIVAGCGTGEVPEYSNNWATVGTLSNADFRKIARGKFDVVNSMYS